MNHQLINLNDLDLFISLLHKLFTLTFDLDPSRGMESSVELVIKLSIKVCVLPFVYISVVRHPRIQTIISIISMIFFIFDIDHLNCSSFSQVINKVICN